MCSKTPSKFSKVDTRRAAVLTPTPGTPGRLSEVSPRREA